MRYFIGNKMVGSKHYQLCSVQECLDYLNTQSEIEVDTETEGFDCHTKDVLCIQFGTPEKQYVIDTSVIQMSSFKSLLEDNSKTFLLQNAKFDIRFLLKHNIHISNVYDTMLAECLLTAGDDNRSVSLLTLCKKYLDVDLDKSVRGDIHKEGLSDRVIVYAADDVRYLTKIKELQMEQINKWELNDVLDLENKVVKVFAEMEYHGVLIDQEKWLGVAEQTEKSVVELESQLDEIVENTPELDKYLPKQLSLFEIEGRKLEVNWGSPAQKLSILQDLGIDIKSTADPELQKNKGKHEIVPLMIAYSKQAKLANAFGRDFLKFVNKKTGRIHPTYWQILHTGRISVKEPNVNQIPSKGDTGATIRSAFIPRPGYKIVGGDYSGMELRIIAEFSKDPLWVDTFNNGGDLHSILCAQTFGIPIEDVKKPFPEKPSFKYRDVQKTINFGLAYGMSKFKLADTMQIPVEKADEIIKKFFSIVPKVEGFLTGLGNLGKNRGFIRTGAPFRRVRWFPQFKESKSQSPRAGKLAGDIERASKNTPIQGSNGDVIKVALIKTLEVIKQENWPVKILLSVYDEIQTECLEERAEAWKHRLDEIMIDAAKVVVKNTPVVVDCAVSDYWQK